MRIAIVNDLMLAVEALRRVVLSVPEYSVAWVAVNGKEAVEKCAADVPDIILMDLIMPVMDGVEATRLIMKATPCAILVVTATVAGNAAKVFEAMGYGALDAVCTPTLGPKGKVEGGAALLLKISLLSRLIKKSPIPQPPPVPVSRGSSMDAKIPTLVAIGCSTGGPKALADILNALPATLNATIVAIQHVDAQFAPGLVDWLATQSHLHVRLAAEGARLEAGSVYLAASNDHLVLRPDLTLHYTPDPADYPYRPSVDAFFQSAVRCWPKRDLAILLTGMGRDGAQGLLDLRQAGWYTLAQDEHSSVLYGMPKAAAELGAAREILPLNQIAPAIIRHVNLQPNATDPRNPS